MFDNSKQIIELSSVLLELAQIAEGNYVRDVPWKSDYRLLEKRSEKLVKIDLGLLGSDKEKKAFWINVYNAFTKYLIVDMQIKKSIQEKPWFFFWPKINVGGEYFSLDDIEHGILRSNRRAPYRLMRQFKWGEKRKRFICSELDYRVHFALNCGAKSCPPVSSYTSEDIDTQLDLAEYSFSNAEFEINHEKQVISCSRVYKWYRKDFAGVYLDNPEYKQYQVKLKPYDWSVR